MITLKGGTMIKSKIIESDKTEVRYRQFEDRNDSIYSFPKSDILMLKFKDGPQIIYPITQPISFSDSLLVNRALDFRHCKSQVTRGRVATVMGILSSLLGIGLITPGVYYLLQPAVTITFISGPTPKEKPYFDQGIILSSIGSTFLGFGVGWITFGALKIKKGKRALRKFNETNSTMSFELMLRPDVNTTTMVAGAGMKIKF